MVALEVDEVERPVGVLFEYCCQVYKRMLEDAEPVSDLTDEEPTIIWSGFLTKLICQELNFSVPYYSFIKNGLVRMGSIRQIRRGGAGTPSLWEVIKEPEEEAFRNSEPARLSRARVKSTTEQRFRDIIKRLDEQQEVIDALVEINNARIGEDKE